MPPRTCTGSLMTAAKYDAATGVFGVFDARGFSVPESPTRADAETALVLLKDILTEFSFPSDTDLAAAFARWEQLESRSTGTPAPVK